MDQDTTTNVETTSDSGATEVTDLPAAPAQEETQADDRPAKVFSQAEVEEMVRDRLARERRRWSREQKPPESPSPQPKAKPAAKPEPAAEPSAPQEPTMREWRVFERAITELGLTDRQSEVVEEYFLKERPGRNEILTFVKDLATDLGWAKSDPQPTQRERTNADVGGAPPQETKVRKPANPAAIDNNAPAVAPSWKQVVNPDQLTKDQIAQIIAEKGTRDGQKYIRQLAERYHRGTVVRPPTD